MRLLETQAIRVRLPKSYMWSKKTLSELFFFPFLFIDWTGIVPTNPSIPAGLLQVLKDPFPLPSPAPPPPSDTPYAKPVPHELNALSLRNAIMASTSDSLNGKGKSMESLFTPYEPPSHYVAISGSHVDEVAHEVKKMDPYEEGKQDGL